CSQTVLASGETANGFEASTSISFTKADAGLTRGTQKPAQVERWTIAENWAAADRARSTANVALAVLARFAPAVAPAKRFAFARLAAAAPARPIVHGQAAVRPPPSSPPRSPSAPSP